MASPAEKPFSGDPHALARQGYAPPDVAWLRELGLRMAGGCSLRPTISARHRCLTRPATGQSQRRGKNLSAIHLHGDNLTRNLLRLHGA